MLTIPAIAFQRSNIGFSNHYKNPSCRIEIFIPGRFALRIKMNKREDSTLI